MAIFRVTNTNDIGKGSLQQAIREANALSGKDTINFDGVFADSIADTITLSGSSLTIRDDLSIQGTGAEKLTVSGNNKSRVFNIASGITVEIAGLTIANGYSDQPIASNYEYKKYTGGGIVNEGTLTVNNSIIRNNRAEGVGGGIGNFGILTVNNSTVKDNIAKLEGGGIGNNNYDNTNAVTVNNSIISGNSTGGSQDGSGSGGGTAAVGVIINSTITGNSAGGDGGGISRAFLVINSTISNNSAGEDGGGIALARLVINSTIDSNSALSGGGIYNVGLSSSVINSTISGNSGGGIINYPDRYSSLELSNSTVIGNSEYGIYGSYYSSGFTVNNSIIANNTDTDAEGSFSSNGSNLIGNFEGSIGFSIKEKLYNPITDVLDTTLRDNGGPVKTHALVYGSLAINAGKNANVPVDTTDLDGDGNTTEQIPFDARGSGFPRISGEKVDIGAYEAVENVINGTVASDTINGTAANDIITGYQGRDILSGGSGANAFVYTSISDLGDTISDFQAGRDKIVLQELFKSLNLGNLDFTSAISGGYLGFETQGSNTIVLIDPDGSAGLGRSVRLLTVSNVSATALNNAANFVFSLPKRPTPTTSIFTVTNTNDSGSGSLRQAILDANASFGKDIIKFGGVFADNIPDTIKGGLAIKDDLSIDAPGANLLTISGGNINIGLGATVDIEGLTIADSTNYDDYDFERGRGIYNEGTLLLSNSTIRNNSAYDAGGGIINSSSATLTINNSTITDNTSVFGAGIYNNGILTVNNSTISNNNARNGTGGIENYGGTVVINNSTITGNTASEPGIGGNTAGVSGSNIIVNNSIIAGNLYIPYNNPTNTINSDVGGNFTSNGHNLIGSLKGSTGFNTNEQLNVPITEVIDTTLRDNGGAIKTHALVIGSPAINAGLNADIPADTADLDGDGNTTEPVPYDQRGSRFARISGRTVDIGAYEAVINVINGTPTRDIIDS
jgi:hypothetical protein